MGPAPAVLHMLQEIDKAGQEAEKQGQAHLFWQLPDGVGHFHPEKFPTDETSWS